MNHCFNQSIFNINKKKYVRIYNINSWSIDWLLTKVEIETNTLFTKMHNAQVKCTLDTRLRVC